MPKLRLTKSLREKLRALADKQVRCPVEDAALAKAYEKAAKLFGVIVEARYPAADMAILEKYKQGTTHSGVRFQLTPGGVVEFIFNKDDQPFFPNNCYGLVGIADEKATAAFEEWEAARRAVKTARDAKLSDYRSLINFSRTLEDVTEVWAEAEFVRPPTSFAVIALSADTIARIKADAATHERLAA